MLLIENSLYVTKKHVIICHVMRVKLQRYMYV